MSDSETKFVKEKTEKQTFVSEKQWSEVDNADKKSVLSSCRICLSSIWDPALLDCGHRFCERCLDKYWKATQEPEFVVCPLCRDYAFKVGFVQRDKIKSTRDFRKRFDPNHVDLGLTSEPSCSKNATSTLYLKLSILMPVIYFTIKYLKPLIMNFLMFF